MCYDPRGACSFDSHFCMRIVVREIKGQIIRLESVVLPAATFGVHNRFVALEIRPESPPPPGPSGERKKNAPGEAAQLRLCVGQLTHRRLQVR